MCGGVPPDSESSEPPDVSPLHLTLPPSLQSSPSLLLSPPPVLFTSSSLLLLSSWSPSPSPLRSTSTPLLTLHPLLLAFPSPSSPWLTIQPPQSYPPGRPPQIWVLASSPVKSPLASPLTRQLQTIGSDMLLATPPFWLSLQETKLIYPPTIWYPNTSPMSQASAQSSLFVTPAWSSAPPGMVRTCSEVCVPMFCPCRYREMNFLEFIVGLKDLKTAVFVFIIIKYPDCVPDDTFLAVVPWEFHISDVTQAFIRLKLGCLCSCMSCVAALCRILPWLISVQPPVYLPPHVLVESLLLTCSDLHEVWVSLLICSTTAMERSQYSIKVWWCYLVELPPLPPVPPDPPDTILSPLCVFAPWFRDSPVLTLSSIGDMSLMTVLIYTASIPPFTLGSILSTHWNDWNSTGLGSIARVIAFRLKLLSPHLPLYEDRLPLYEEPLPLYEEPLPLYEEPLPLYEDHLPLYEDLLPFYEDLVTLPLYEEIVPVYWEFLDSSSLFASFTEFYPPLVSSFVLNDWDTKGVIKGSSYWCFIALVVILEMGNCALVAVLISGVRSSTHGFILLNNSNVKEIRGRLRDFRLFKCFVVFIFPCFPAYFGVFVVYFAMSLWNIYSSDGA